MAASGAREGIPTAADTALTVDGGVNGASAVDEHRIAVAFERVPRLVDALRAAGPYATIDEVMRSAAQLVDDLGEETQVALLNAHPRIGADRADLSDVSASEQGVADAATMAKLVSLNDEYELRFGFRCVVFVAGRSQAELLPVLRERLRQTRGEELATGIDEFLTIARDRLSR